MTAFFFEIALKNNQKRAIFILFSCQTAQNIIEVGKRLIAAKALVQHGHWQAWLNDNFQLTERTAQNFMKCSERFGKNEINFGFSSTQMIQLLSLPSTEETEKFIAEKAEQADIGAVVLLAEMKCGQLLNQMPKTSGGDRRERICNLFAPPRKG